MIRRTYYLEPDRSSPVYGVYKKVEREAVDDEGWCVRKRIKDLMFFRSLQIDRHINIETIKAGVDGTDQLLQSFGGGVNALKKADAVADNGIVGTDDKGYPFKDWIPGKDILSVLKDFKIKPFYPEALELLQKKGQR